MNKLAIFRNVRGFDFSRSFLEAHLWGNRHNVEYHTRHKLESHNVEKNMTPGTTSNIKFSILVITSKKYPINMVGKSIKLVVKEKC